MKKKILLTILIFCLIFAYGCGSSEKYTLNFDSNGGSPCKASVAKSIEDLDLPAQPVMQNYVFDGWFLDKNTWNIPLTDESLRSNLSSNNKNLTVYAKWRGINVKIILNDEKGQYIEYIEVEYGKPYNLPIIPDSENGMFVGWQDEKGKIITNESGESKGICDFTEEIKLSPLFLNGNLEIIFDSQGGSFINKKTVKTGSLYGELPLPVNRGFDFVGWFREKECIHQVNENNKVVETGSVILYAKWNPIEYTVIFNGNGADTVENYKEIFGFEEKKALSLNRFKKSGYKFIGWKIKGEGEENIAVYSDGEIVSFSYEKSSEIYLEAVWQRNIYSVYFKLSESASRDESEYIVLSFDDKIYIDDRSVKKDGYLISGWRQINGKNSGRIYNIGNQIDCIATKSGEIIDLVPVWDPIIYYLKYLNEYDQETILTLKYNEPFIIPENPYEDGYKRGDGWTLGGEYLADEFKNKVFHKGDVVLEMSNIQYCTLEMKRHFANKPFTVRIYSTDGKNLLNEQAINIEEGKNAVINTDFIGVKENYTFAGFKSENNLISSVFDPSKANIYREVLNLNILWKHNYLGNGTEVSPYLIENAEDLKNLAVFLFVRENKNQAVSFRFENDIDLKGEYIYAAGSMENDYNNNLHKIIVHGENHIVKNFRIKEYDGDIIKPAHATKKLGLFSNISEGGYVENLRFENCSIEGRNTHYLRIGFFVGIAGKNVKIKNCSVKNGRINVWAGSNANVGGIAGECYGVVESCFFGGTIELQGNYANAGGIVCYATDIYGCGAVADINGTCNEMGAGGLAFSVRGKAEQCYSAVNIRSDSIKAKCCSGILIKYEDFLGSAIIKNVYYSNTSLLEGDESLNVSQEYAAEVPFEKLKDVEFINKNLPVFKEAGWIISENYPMPY